METGLSLPDRCCRGRWSHPRCSLACNYMSFLLVQCDCRWQIHYIRHFSGKISKGWGVRVSPVRLPGLPIFTKQFCTEMYFCTHLLTDWFALLPFSWTCLLTPYSKSHVFTQPRIPRGRVQPSRSPAVNGQAQRCQMETFSAHGGWLERDQSCPTVPSFRLKSWSHNGQVIVIS